MTRHPHVVDEFIGPDECQALIATYQRAAAADPPLPGCRVFGDYADCAGWQLRALAPPAVQALLADLHQRIPPVTRRHFRERAVLALDSTILTALAPGAFHGRHADYERPLPDGTWGDNHTPWRQYAAMVYLNSSGVDYTGGELCFPTLGLRVQPQAGRLVTFSGGRAHVHETTPVVGGTRYALATWLTADPARWEPWP